MTASPEPGREPQTGEVAKALPPPDITVAGPIAWLRTNLFNTWYNSILTIVGVLFIYKLVTAMGSWALNVAEWRVITENMRLFMVGRFPWQQVWRVWAVLGFVSFLSGVSWGIWGKAGRRLVIAVAAGLLTAFVLPLTPGVRAGIVLTTGLLAAGVYGGAVLANRNASLGSRLLVSSWVLAFLVIGMLLKGPGYVPFLAPIETSRWGGLLLTMILAVTGILASFPLGVLLALGRRSTLPVVRIVCVAVVEGVRGVPLVTVLFTSAIMLPLFLPSRPDLVIRAMAGIILFASAYVAANVRGGLQSISRGQIEAAQAVGLNGVLITLLIVLPQALRNVIPALVGQFISLFKDTSLVYIIALIELLGIGQSILANPKFLGLHAEVYIFVAFVYFVFSYAMSVASRRLEVALGVGER